MLPRILRSGLRPPRNRPPEPFHPFRGNQTFGPQKLGRPYADIRSTDSTHPAHAAPRGSGAPGRYGRNRSRSPSVCTASARSRRLSIRNRCKSGARREGTLALSRASIRRTSSRRAGELSSPPTRDPALRESTRSLGSSYAGSKWAIRGYFKVFEGPLGVLLRSERRSLVGNQRRRPGDCRSRQRSSALPSPVGRIPGRRKFLLSSNTLSTCNGASEPA